MNTEQEERFNTALGSRLMILRRAHKYSQDTLGTKLGVRGQQIHKYETGENRMPPTRIAQCAKIFRVPVGYFYGEDETPHLTRFDHSIINTAGEIKDLPPEIRQQIYALCRIINMAWGINRTRSTPHQKRQAS